MHILFQKIFSKYSGTWLARVIPFPTTTLTARATPAGQSLHLHEVGQDLGGLVRATHESWPDYHEYKEASGD